METPARDWLYSTEEGPCWLYGLAPEWLHLAVDLLLEAADFLRKDRTNFDDDVPDVCVWQLGMLFCGVVVSMVSIPLAISSGMSTFSLGYFLPLGLFCLGIFPSALALGVDLTLNAGWWSCQKLVAGVQACRHKALKVKQAIKMWWKRKKTAGHLEKLDPKRIKPYVSSKRGIDLTCRKRLLTICKKVVAQQFRKLTAAERISVIDVIYEYESGTQGPLTAAMVTFLYERKLISYRLGVRREKLVYSAHVLRLVPDERRIVDIKLELSWSTKQLDGIADVRAEVIHFFRALQGVTPLPEPVKVSATSDVGSSSSPTVVLDPDGDRPRTSGLVNE